MRGFVARWVLRRVMRSALAFEADSISLYRRLTAELAGDPGSDRAQRACRDDLQDSLCHLLEEEQEHWKLVEEAAAGRVTVEELERLLAGHRYARYDAIRPLSAEELTRWGGELTRALDQEEKTWVFYGNLRRMSKIPSVKRAFEVLAAMEKEHLDILRRLLGRA